MTTPIREKTVESSAPFHLAARRGGRFILPLCFSLLGLCAAGGWFIHGVLSLPTRTPILTLSGIYGPEWDLNCWVAEDLRAITSLKDGTFSVYPLPRIDHLAGGFWDEADATIRQAQRSCGENVPLLVYVNLHGAVNDEGAACLIPPNASVNDASTWFPVKRLLDRIEHVRTGKPRHPIVLLLECGKLRTHWPAGITNNEFAARLETVVTEHQQRFSGSQVTIISSVSLGERSNPSREGAGNLFTQAIVRGLTGKADGQGPQSLVDGLVDTDELIRFTRQHVGELIKKQRAAPQNPIIVRVGCDKPVPLARAMKPGSVAPLRQTPAPSSTEVERLKVALDVVTAIGEKNPIAVDPHAWAQLQRTSHGLFQSVFGGDAVRVTRERWYSRLARQAQSLRQEMSDRSGESSMLVDFQADRNATVIWSAIEHQPSRDTATAAIRDVDSQKTMPVPMLHALLSHPESAFWGSRDLIRRTAKTQTKWLETKSRLPDGIFPAIDAVCEPVDQARRALADAILADQELESIRQAVSHFEGQVDDRCETLETLRTAWQLRDRVFVELPFLVQWMDESSVPSHAEIDEEETKGDIADVMALDVLLTKFVDRTHPGDHPSIDEISVASTRAAKFIGSLNERRDEARHLDDGTGADEPRCTERCQLITADFAPTPKTQSDGKEPERSAYDPRCAECLSVILGVNTEEVSAAELRDGLRSLSEPKASESGLEGRWRRVVSLVVDENFVHVIDRARKASRQQRLASRANEVLDDFWYAPASQGSPYFATTSEALIGLANSTAVENPIWRSRKRLLTTKLESRRAASAKGMLIRATSQPSYTEDGAQLVSIQLRQQTHQTDLPPGTANLVLRDKDKPEPSSSRSIEIHADHAVSDLDIPLDTSRRQESVAELYFRGNTYRSEIMVSDTAFGVLTAANDVDRKTSVTISDGMDARRAVCFVLDCSASMNDAVESEAVRSGSTTQSATKFDAARSALYEMLRRIESEDTEVGMVLYGHRMAVGGKDQQVLLQKRYFKRFPFPQSVQPYEDVAVALPTGRFDRVQLELARQHFDAAAPWGQTPLYLAISKAIEDVSRGGEGASKNVVVISDGRNYQFNPTADAIVSLDTVVQQATNHGVRLHVIGFGLPKEDLAIASEEFANLAKRTGGESIAEVGNATELLRRLEQFASSTSCNLELPDGKSIPGKFGESIALDHIHAVNTPITAKINDAASTIYVSPGDELRLVTNHANQLISTPPYLDGSPKFSNLATANGNVMATRIGVQIPDLGDQDCRFLASLQRSDQQVAERPAAIWLEIRPKKRGQLNYASGAPSAFNQAETGSQGTSTNGNDAVYRTNTVRWLPGMSCPVAELSCLDWPKEASGYELQAWCANRKPDSQAIPLTEADLSSGQEKFEAVPGYEGVRYKVERIGREIQVSFQYENDVEPDSMLVAEMEGLRIEQSRHWYDASRKVSIHQFTPAKVATLDLDPPQNIQSQDSATIQVHTITEMKSISVRTTEPIIGEMFPAIATLPATNH